MSRWLLYFHTLRYLKPKQIGHRLLFRLRCPKPDLRPAPVVRKCCGEWRPPAHRNSSMLGSSRFCFLNTEHDVISKEAWNSSSLSKLWLYNLHYFDDLNAYGASGRREWHKSLIEQWLEDNPPAKGNGWEPYPLSLRIVNWLKWSFGGNCLTETAIHSLAVQARFLTERLERHLLGNHLFANAKALVLAGCFFEGDEARAWLKLGMDIISHEIPEQILADGGHFERSTMYHALAFEDMLDLLNFAGLYPDVFASSGLLSYWSSKAASMGHWLAAMCHPDGEISFFNDAAIGIAPSPDELFSYAERLNVATDRALKEKVVWLKDSGYVRAQKNGVVLLADVAPVGPDYLPGHAHADTLSFEFSLGEQRIFVNSGTSRYGLGHAREWERSTAAHNTVEIDGQNSSEVWAGFRVARRAYPFEINVSETSAGSCIEAQHNGYRRLPGGNFHHRKWLFNYGSLIIEDEITGTFHEAVARFYLHPGIKPDVQNISKGQLIMQLPQGGEVDFEVEGGTLHLENKTWRPGFGVSEANCCLSVKFHAASVRTEIKWHR